MPIKLCKNIPDLGVYAVSGLVVRSKELGYDSSRQVILHTRLLSTEKRGHLFVGSRS
jgi:hypothetical protein